MARPSVSLAGSRYSPPPRSEVSAGGSGISAAYATPIYNKEPASNPSPPPPKVYIPSTKKLKLILCFCCFWVDWVVRAVMKISCNFAKVSYFWEQSFHIPYLCHYNLLLIISNSFRPKNWRFSCLVNRLSVRLTALQYRLEWKWSKKIYKPQVIMEHVWQYCP